MIVLLQYLGDSSSNFDFLRQTADFVFIVPKKSVPVGIQVIFFASLGSYDVGTYLCIPITGTHMKQ